MKALPYLLILVALAWIASKSQLGDGLRLTAAQKQEGATAYQLAQREVRRQSSAPANARISTIGEEDASVTRLDDGAWRATGWIDRVLMSSHVRVYWRAKVDPHSQVVTIEEIGRHSEVANAPAATPAQTVSRLANGQYVEHDATVSGMQSVGGGGGGKWHQHAGPTPANPLDQPGRR